MQLKELIDRITANLNETADVLDQGAEKINIYLGRADQALTRVDEEIEKYDVREASIKLPDEVPLPGKVVSMVGRKRRLQAK